MAAASQAVGLVQIYLLTRDHGAGKASDAYFFLFNASQLPIQILLLGFAYPVILNSPQGAETRLVRQLRLLTPPACLLTVGVGAGWLALQGRLGPSLYPLIVVSLANGYLGALVWYRAVHLAAEGKPVWLAASVLPANLAACIAIAYAWSPASLRVMLMVSGLAAGNLGLYLYLRVNDIGAAPSTAPVADAPWGSVGNFWYLGKAIVSYVGANLIQALTILLPASSVTTLNIIVKIASVPPTVLVNALLPHFVHRNSVDRQDAVRFARVMTLLLALPFAGALVLSIGADSQIVRYVVVGVAWMIPASLNSIAHRVAARFLSPSASVWSVATTIIIVLLLIGLSQTAWFTLLVVLVASMALDAIPGACLWWTLDARGLSVVCVATLVITGLVVARPI